LAPFRGIFQLVCGKIKALSSKKVNEVLKRYRWFGSGELVTHILDEVNSDDSDEGGLFKNYF